MNRSKDMQILSSNPAGAGQVASAVRKGIVKGFMAIKNPKEKEADIRKLYKIPDVYGPAVMMPNGDMVFSHCDSDITVKPNGEAREGHMALNQHAESHEFTNDPWDP